MRSVRVGLSYAASLPAVFILVWATGYLYWQVRISRALADFKRDFPSPAYYLNLAEPELDRIGSRGIPRVFRELDAALSGGDQRQAFVLLCGLTNLFNAADEVKLPITSIRFRRIPPDSPPSMEVMRAWLAEYQLQWQEHRLSFPPWWMWWNGRRRA